VLIEFSPEFLPTIVDYQEYDRDPQWYVVKVVSTHEKILLRILDYVDMNYHNLTYLHFAPKKKPTTRAWVPGYMFLEFDMGDRWQQVLRMPGVLEFLGKPTPLSPGVMESLLERMPPYLPKAAATSCVAPGTLVRVIKGAYNMFELVVTAADRRNVEGVVFIFGRPTIARISRSDVEVIG
jgi:transcription antitermination factor NusG